MSDFFLAIIASIRREGMVERGTIDILRMGWKVIADRCRKIEVRVIGHGLLN